MITQESELIFDYRKIDSNVSIIIPLYNYQNHIEQTLNSVEIQSHKGISVIIVDDCSADNSVDVVLGWIKRRKLQINLSLLRNRSNARLSITRNTGISYSRTQYCFMLDADNMLYPRCIEKHLECLNSRADADAAYSLIHVFEGGTDIIGAGVFTKEGLINKNFIDAMALFRKDVLVEMDGYSDIKYGWEDYDLWLRMLESGRIAIHIPEILSMYRQHATSMLRAETNVNDNIRYLHEQMVRRHPWLRLH